jgi:hypothetical protein
VDADPRYITTEGECVLQGRFCGTYSDRDSTGFVFRPDASGNLVLEGLDPSTAIAFHVQDALGTRIHEVTLEPLGKEGHRHVDVSLVGRAHELVVTVRDPQGKPFFGVEVRVSTREGTVRKFTATNGKVHFPMMCAEKVDIEVETPGYAKVRRHAFPLVRPVETVGFELERGLKLTVEVVDAKSRPVDGATLTVSSSEPGMSWTPWTRGEGKFEVADLPAVGEVLLTLELGGRIYQQRHEPRIPLARFSVPVHGRVVLDWALPRGTETIDRMPVLRSTEKATAIMWGPTTDETEGQWIAESVLPGTYDAVLVREGTNAAWVEAFPGTRITVLADQTTTVLVRP